MGPVLELDKSVSIADDPNFNQGFCSTRMCVQRGLAVIHWKENLKN